jgi:hypothetical protein
LIQMLLVSEAGVGGGARKADKEIDCVARIPERTQKNLIRAPSYNS